MVVREDENTIAVSPAHTGLEITGASICNMTGIESRLKADNNRVVLAKSLYQPGLYVFETPDG